jgi:hypothetical protein
MIGACVVVCVDRRHLVLKRNAESEEMVPSDALRVMDAIVQPEKAEVPTEARFFGRDTVVSPKQSLKAESPTDERLAGRFTEDSFTQFAKALCSMIRRDGERTRVERFEQALNALCLISSTLRGTVKVGN